MSIQSQKAILEKFAREMGKAAYSFYVDNGYSSTNFQRPSFQKMIADIEDGKIDTVITKDYPVLAGITLKAAHTLKCFSHSTMYATLRSMTVWIPHRTEDLTSRLSKIS